MRTTIALPEFLLTEAKHVAAERRTSLARLVEEGLRAYLAELRCAPAPSEKQRRLPVLRKPRLVVGVDLADTSTLMEFE